MIRLCRALKTGVIVTVSKGGARVEPSQDLPRGAIVVISMDKTKSQVLMSPTTGTKELMDEIVEAARRGKRDLRSFD